MAELQAESRFDVVLETGATVEVTLTAGPTLHFDMVGTGPPGKDGAPGEKGDPGPGVPPGGSAGQILRKRSDEDYDSEFADFDYNELENKPSIEGVPLMGNQTLPALNLNALTNQELEQLLSI